MEYKVGDKVVIRPDLEEKSYEGVDAIGEMVLMAGEVYEIMAVYEDEEEATTYKLLGDQGNWYWTASMLLPYIHREADESMLMDLFQ